MSANGDCLVLVTGATGFIGLHIIKLLLQEGCNVRGTVRSLKNKTKLESLENISRESSQSLELVEADLTKDIGWVRAAEACRYCIHVASPLPSAEPEKEEDVIIPAVEGTKRVLRACVNSHTIERVVLTSSSCAVEDHLNTNRVYTEDDWTDETFRYVVAYAKSKTMAEKAAWNFVRSLPPGQKIELAVINPTFVLGPTLNNASCSSLEFVKRLMDGSVPLIPKLYLPFCDVRDVALAHLRAMTAIEAANNRHLIVSAHMWWQDIARILRNEMKVYGYSIPTRPAPNSVLHVLSIVDRSSKFILPRVGKVYTYSDRRMKEVLNIVNPYDAKDTVIDTVNALIECGVIKKTKRYRKHYKQS